MGVPYFYDYQNIVDSSTQPANAHILNTEMGRFFQRYLLKKALSVFKWSVPAWWDENYFLYVLYCRGYVAVFDSEKFGVIPQQCGLAGYNVFYRPKRVIIANPLLANIHDLEIGDGCELMQLQPDYCGVMDLVNHYAEQLANASAAVNQNIWSTKIATIFYAKDSSEAQTIKKAYDQMTDGTPMVVVRKRKNAPEEEYKLQYDIFNRDVKSSYVVGDLLSDLRKIEAEFDTRIGVPNANTDKRERLITDEVNANNVETHILADMWMDSIQDGIKRIKNKYGIEISCEWRYREDADASNNESMRSVSV